MTKISFTKPQLLISIYAFFSMLDLNSVYARFTNQNLYITEICSLLATCLGIYALFKLKGITKRVLLFLFIYYCYLFIFLIYSPKEDIFGFIIKFSICLPVLVIFFNLDIENIDYYFKYYSHIIYIIALLSLFFYVFTEIVSIISPLNSMYVSWRGDASFKDYFYLYFSADYSYFHSFLRNTGIFVEAPQFGLHLIIALTYELFFNKAFRLRRVIIFMVTIVSTISFGSIIVMLIILFAKYLIIPIHNKYLKMLRIVLSITMFAFMIGIMFSLFVIKINTGNSFKIRLDDFISAFDSWKLHPMFGNGYGNDDVIKQFIGSFRSWSLRNDMVGFSNSVAMILSNGGIYLSMIYIISAILFLRSNISTFYNRCVLVLVLLMMLILNSFAYSMMLINLVAMGYSLGINQKNHINRANLKGE
ncbi:hypothetical protein [Latilactobacillus curvatus]|uniref:hypothetical protein n=1 Tax=Latilactobacillus curvatus TaxID=28038 RepID=UPI002D77610E|nr:hypothetical protein [Latilactobacillus curvatus]WRS46842.1 hypothetical protein VDS61_04035 [Latilactobacillus curvatus]